MRDRTRGAWSAARPALALWKGPRPSGRFNGYYSKQGYLGLGSAPATGVVFRALAEKGCSVGIRTPHSALGQGGFWHLLADN
jgi:hypothetical protein